MSKAKKSATRPRRAGAEPLQSVRPKNLPTDAIEPAESAAQATPSPSSVADAAREHMIAEAAYYRSERRGFEPGHELDDWLAAEAEVVGCSLQRDQSAGGVQ